MASQPLNSQISVNRRVRAQRTLELNRSTTGYRSAGLVMSVPAEEDLQVVLDANRDGTNTVGTNTSLGTKGQGLPLVRTPRVATPLGNWDGSSAVAVSGMNIADIDFPVRIGQDVFLQKESGFAGDPLARTGNAGDDLHQDLRDLA